MTATRERSGSVLSWTREHPRLTDRLLTAVVLAAELAGMWLIHWSGAPRYRAPDAGEVLLTVATVVPLLRRRDHPAAVLVVSGSALFAYQAINYPFALSPAAVFWAVYSYACHRTRDAYWPLSLWLAEVLATLAFGRRGDTQTVLVFLAATAFVWLRGDAIRSGLLEAQRERDARARQAVADERSRIARELHDVVAHALGIIVMQAGGAGAVPDLGETQAKSVLGTIERTGRQAFAEMRRLVGVLREGEAAELSPQPTIADLPSLASSLAASGLHVSIEVSGDPQPVPVGVELAAYRVVQEALTNSFKHAQARTATVRLRWLDQALRVEVEDDGPPTNGVTRARPAADSGGHGLVGMRERVSIFGGSLHAAPRPEGGFRVSACFPLEASP